MAWIEHVREPAGSYKMAQATFANLRLELWHVASGGFKPGTFDCNEVASVISGRTRTWRSSKGVTQEYLIEPGASRISPAGIYETEAGLSDPVDILYARLPSQLVGESALSDFGIDPSKVELAYAGGLKDPMLRQIILALHGVMSDADDPSTCLFVDGMRAALVGHLLSKYTIDRWQPPITLPDLDPRRLKRVLDLIEVRFTEPLSLAELAAEACLSEYHFSRLFRAATGLSPYRYVTVRRVQAAQRILAHTRASLLEVALETGFGSQANFIRVFRKCTGLTPGQYRGLHCSKDSLALEG